MPACRTISVSAISIYLRAAIHIKRYSICLWNASSTAKGTGYLTQAATTLLIVGGNVFAAFVPVVSPMAGSTLTNAMFVVLGFYYGRTNHQKIGGVQLGR